MEREQMTRNTTTTLTAIAAAALLAACSPASEPQTASEQPSEAVAASAAADQPVDAAEPASNTAEPAGDAGQPADAEEPAAGTAGQAAAGQGTAAPRPRLVAPIRGEANLNVTRPVTTNERVDGRNWIVTKMQVKNMSSGAIAGLKADEFWFDAAGNPVGGATFRHRKPLQPQEVITVEFRTPRDPKMASNQYQFSHANGTIKPTSVPKL
jgi:hypothetical protein